MEFAVILSLGEIGVHTFGENVDSLLVTQIGKFVSGRGSGEATHYFYPHDYDSPAG